MTQKPTLGRIVHYRGKFGLFAMRAALVSADVDSLMVEGVASGEVPALDSDMHCHLTVFTPSSLNSFPEYNVPYADRDENGEIQPGHWTWPVMK